MADDLNSVSVQLSLLSGEDTQAAKELARELKAIQGLFKTINSDFASYSKNLLDLTDILNRNRAAQQVGASRGGRSDVDAAAEAVRLAATTPQEAQDALGNIRKQAQALRDAQASKATDAAKQEGDRIREEAKRNQDGGDDAPKPVWGQRFKDRDNQEATIPRFGQLNLQDFVRGLRNTVDHVGETGRVGTKRFGFDIDPEDTKKWTKMADNLDMAQRGIGGAYTGYKAYQFARQGLERVGMDPFDNADRGGQLGYERGGTAFGFQDPFSSAAGEGYRQSIDRWGLKFMGGINGQQASSIVDATAGAGFGGNTAHDISYNLLAPLMKKYGLDPETIIPFTAAVRTGQSSVSELADALKNVGDTARNASMTLPETMQALQQTVEAVQSAGGTIVGGIQRGQMFQSLTGLPASVGAQLGQNPYVSAMTAGMTGIAPQIQGVLPADVALSGQVAAVHQMSQMFSGRNFRNKDFTVADPNNPGTMVHERVSGQDQADAYAAQALGMDIGQYRKIKDNQNAIVGGSRLQTLAKGYLDDYNRLAGSQSGVSRTITSEWNKSGAGSTVTHVDVANHRFRTSDGKLHDISNDEWKHYLKTSHSADPKDLMEKINPHDRRMDYGELVRSAEQSGIWGGHTVAEKKAAADKVLDKFKNESPQERYRRMVQAINHQVGKAQSGTNPAINVSFTGLAGKIFKGAAHGDFSKLVTQGSAAQATTSTPSPRTQLPNFDPTGMYGTGANSGP